MIPFHARVFSGESSSVLPRAQRRESQPAKAGAQALPLDATRSEASVACTLIASGRGASAVMSIAEPVIRNSAPPARVQSAPALLDTADDISGIFSNLSYRDFLTHEEPIAEEEPGGVGENVASVADVSDPQQQPRYHQQQQQQQGRGLPHAASPQVPQRVRCHPPPTTRLAHLGALSALHVLLAVHASHARIALHGHVALASTTNCTRLCALLAAGAAAAAAAALPAMCVPLFPRPCFLSPLASPLFSLRVCLTCAAVHSHASRLVGWRA
jgi:hypothetical protein